MRDSPKIRTCIYSRKDFSDEKKSLSLLLSVSRAENVKSRNRQRLTCTSFLFRVTSVLEGIAQRNDQQ
ncbi:hypothetical protein TSAR_007418, partial [Trichomalopsis sarcophagae]